MLNVWHMAGSGRSFNRLIRAPDNKCMPLKLFRYALKIRVNQSIMLQGKLRLKS